MTRADEVKLKITRIREWMEAAQISAVVLSSQVNFAWISGGGRSHIATGNAEGVASVVVTADAAWVLTSNIEARRLAEEELPENCFSVLEWPWYEPGASRRALGEICDPSRAVSDLGIFGLPFPADDFTRLRYTLTEPEIERLRLLGRDGADAVEETCTAVRRGHTEHEVAGALASRCYDRDILPLVILVAADERISAHRHPLPTRMEFDDTLLVSLSGRRHGLHVSLTRMVCASEPGAELVRRHGATAAVDARLALASVPGASLGEVFREGLQQYSLEGFGDEWRLHHQGGLTGYSGREIFATSESRHVLEANQVLAWNPSITGAKSEDTILVTDSGPEVLTRTGAWPEIIPTAVGGSLPRPALRTVAS